MGFNPDDQIMILSRSEKKFNEFIEYIRSNG